MFEQLVEVMLGNHLHQTLGAHQALGYRIEARLDRHDRENQEGIQAHLPTGIVRSAHELLGDIRRDPVFTGDVTRQRAVFLGVRIVHPVEQRDRSVITDRADRGRAVDVLVEEQGLPAREDEHHGREPDEGKTVMKYRRHSSKLIQQVLL